MEIGTRLGPYEITARIGAGGMGSVYRATDTELQREVAIKVLPAEVTADPERRLLQGGADPLAQGPIEAGAPALSQQLDLAGGPLGFWDVVAVGRKVRQDAFS